MSAYDEKFTIGVEEEYQIINPRTRELQPRAATVLPKAESVVGDSVTPELYLSQIEISTPVCQTLADVRCALGRLRREVIAAAEEGGSCIAAAGTHPFSHWDEQKMTPKARYLEIAEQHAQLAREQLIFGCHVHVGISDQEAAIGVMNRVRPWLAVLLALSSNSPFWLQEDTGYSSFRTAIWRRWPLAGTPSVFASRSEYDALVDTLVATNSITDATNIYWDVRPSARFETLEFRGADVCMTVDEAVMIAGLSRALARTCFELEMSNKPIIHSRPELLSAAKWRAARYGLDAQLIDVEAGNSAPARVVVEKCLAFVRPSLEDHGEWSELLHLVNQTFSRGTGASRQREAYARNCSLENVVDFVVKETANGVTK